MNTIMLIIVLLAKNLLMLGILLCLKKLKSILKLVIDSELLSIRIFSAKVTLKIDREEYLLFNLCLKSIHGYIKLNI